MEDKKQLRRKSVRYILPMIGLCTAVALYRSEIGLRTSINEVILSKRSNSRSAVKDTLDVKWSPWVDILTEEEVMSQRPLTDIKKGLDLSKSRVALIGNSSVFHVGDEIKLHIIALDGYGKLRTQGGDQFRVRIFEDRLNASASGYVIDHKNGSYTAVIRALWSGKPNISVVIGYPREVVRALYDIFTKLPGTLQYLANYRVIKNKRITMLQGLYHPILDRITNISKDLCNRTMQNGGAALYCSKPEHANCTNFVGYGLKTTPVINTFTKAETDLYKMFGHDLRSQQILVKEYPRRQPVTACKNYNISSLWMKESPIGYFYNKSWNMIHCRGPADKSVTNCLKNKHFIFVGDSTMRQWFEYLVSEFKCIEMPMKREMYKVCHNIDLNMKAEISFHSIPGHYIVKEPVIQSIPYFIETFNFSPRIILVFHMQSHVSYYHPRVFRLRMREIRKSFDNYIHKLTDFKVFLKGPHTFHPRYGFNDYFGYVYRTIMLEIFEGLYDKIVYLDSKDMTIATNQIDNHPTSEVIQGMVNQFLSYVCEA